MRQEKTYMHAWRHNGMKPVSILWFHVFSFLCACVCTCPFCITGYQNNSATIYNVFLFCLGYTTAIT